MTPRWLRFVMIGILVVAAIGLLVARHFRVQGSDEIRWVDPASLKLGPIREKPLTPDQVAQIRRLHDRLAPIDGWSLEKRVDLFSRDVDPDQEIAIYGRILDACDRAFAKLGPLSPEQKLEVYGLLVVVSAAPADEVLSRYTPKSITSEQAKAAVSAW